MADWVKEGERLGILVAGTGVVGVVVGAIRVVISYRYESKLQWLAVMCGTVFVTVIVGLLVAETTLPSSWALAVVGLSAFIADNLILALLTVASHFGSNPLRVMRRVMAAWRGLPTPPDTDKAPLDPTKPYEGPAQLDPKKPYEGPTP